jgi:HK97 family phage portal protein
MIRRFLGLEQRAVTFQDVFGRALDLAGVRTKAGQTVTPSSAMQVTAVWACVRLISEGVATLPLDSFQRIDGVRKPYRPRPDWLDFRLNEFGRIEVISQMVVSLLLAGNAYAAVLTNDLGEVYDLVVLDPEAVTVERRDGRLVYSVNGSPFPGLLLHVPGIMLPGATKGLSPIRAAQETIGLSLAATEFGAAFFGNGAIPGALVEVPGKLSPVGVTTMKDGWNELHRGAGNAHRLAVLTEGAKFSKVSLAPNEAQFLETRQFQVADIARLFGVPPHLIGDASGSTSWGSGLAEQNVAYLQHSLRPWIERLEAALGRVLRAEGRPPGVFVKFNVDALLRGDSHKRMEAYRIGLQEGIYSPDEVRTWEDLPPIPGGKGSAFRIPPPPSLPPATPPTTRSEPEEGE